ncbi:MAG: RsmE family RNA methyltransferase [Betaproteobacteria bacterium]|nr:RsmE family RNA methyltransferase [Betaproteobacteria bacterium]
MRPSSSERCRCSYGCSILMPTPSVILLVGPEAGLSDQEAEAAKAAGFLALHAGPRTLRTETAALAAIAAIQATWGDWADAPSARWLCA